MRIMTVGPTGVVAMQRVLNWMAARSEQVWVSDYYNQCPDLLPGTFDFYPLLPIRRMGGALRRARLGKLAERLEASRMQALASEVQPDVVHVQSIDTRGLACAHAGVKPLLVSTWGGMSQAVAQPDRPFARMTQQIVAASDVVLVDSPALLEPAARWTKADGRVVHLPMGADTQAFRPGRTALALEWRAHFAIPDDTFVLLSPRMWAPYYRHQDVLRAYVLGFSRFQRPTQLAFTCLGGGPQELPHMADVWQEVAHTPAAATVLWLPRIRYGQMPTLYAMSDAVVNYPAMDSFGATLVEAAACQVPLITPLLPTYRDTFVENFATLVAHESIEALADAMVQVVKEAPEERYARLSHARAIVEREYDAAVIKERLWRLYADLAKR